MCMCARARHLCVCTWICIILCACVSAFTCLYVASHMLKSCLFCARYLGTPYHPVPTTTTTKQNFFSFTTTRTTSISSDGHASLIAAVTAVSVIAVVMIGCTIFITWKARASGRGASAVRERRQATRSSPPVARLTPPVTRTYLRAQSRPRGGRRWQEQSVGDRWRAVLSISERPADGRPGVYTLPDPPLRDAGQVSVDIISMRFPVTRNEPTALVPPAYGEGPPAYSEEEDVVTGVRLDLPPTYNEAMLLTHPPASPSDSSAV